MRIKNCSDGYVRRNKTLYVLWGDKGKLILQEALGMNLTNFSRVYSQTCVERSPLSNGKGNVTYRVTAIYSAFI